MKKLILVLALLLGACSSGAPTSSPTDQPPAETEALSGTPVVTPVESSNSSTLASGPITLVALGDSLTQGDGDASGRGYPGRLLEILNGVRPGSDLVNLGQSGWSSDALINGDQGIESQLDRAVVALQNAAAQGRGAVALVWIGSNDLWYLYEYGGDVNNDGEAQDIQRFTANMDTILSRLRKTGASVIVALLDDQSKRPVALKGEAFTAITQAELTRMSRLVGLYNAILSAKAAQYGALTVDFSNTDIFTNPATLYDDGNHPNSAGYDLIAQKWWEVLNSLLGG
ncbi:MAG: GDSL-type esterase/lipase family protein [Anaerolineales bacterium]